jgi:hypothetical protein
MVYRLITSNDIDEFGETVTAFKDKGWQLQGGVSVIYTGSSDLSARREYTQAITKVIDKAESTDDLVAFSCPSHSKAGLACCFASHNDIFDNRGLRCRSKACDIRLPLDGDHRQKIREYDDKVKGYIAELDGKDNDYITKGDKNV